MSQADLERVLERAMSDAEFRQLLARDPDAALAGYDLSGDERASVLESAEGTERDVDARISKRKSKLGGLSGPLDIDDVIR